MRIIGNNPAADNAEITAVASGTLPNGKPVIVNADGTVSVPTSALGTATVFEGSESTYVSATFDSNSNKVVIAYRDQVNSGAATAVVGTVSGSTISFGTVVVFDGSMSFSSCAFDSNSNKVVISYTDGGNSNYGTAIVGTVSGTGISFGTAVVFESASTQYASATFDSNSNKVVIAYTDQGNSNYGTAIVGTVSGTNISFGSAAVFESASTLYITSTFDSNSNKVVIAYRDAGNSNYGTAIVGTISGTNISFGSAVVYEAATSNHTTAIFDSNSNKVVIAYQDNGNSNYGTAIVGTVSGTGISFGTAVVFENVIASQLSSFFDSSNNKVGFVYNDETGDNGTIVLGTVSGTSISFDSPLVFADAGTKQTAAVFDSNSNRTVVAYGDRGNSNSGTALVYNADPNDLTAENFIGIANGAAADGGTARVQIGSGINGAQSSLTAGQQYFVQTDGTLGLTAADPSVIAGTAISATEIIVKG